MLNRNLKKALLFLMFSLLFSGLVLLVTDYLELNSPGASGYYFVVAAYFLGALLSAFLVEKLMSIENPLKTLNINLKFNLWSLSAFLVPFFIFPLTLVLGLLLPETSFAAARFNILDIIKGVFVGGTLIAVIASLAVCGFVGFLFKELAYLGFWRASYITGVCAALWLFPLIFVTNLYDRNYSFPGLSLYLLFVVAVFPVLTFIKTKTKNIFVPAVLTGILFGTASFPGGLIFGGSVFLLGFNGLAGIVAASILAALIYIYNRYLTEINNRIF